MNPSQLIEGRACVPSPLGTIDWRSVDVAAAGPGLYLVGAGSRTCVAYPYGPHGHAPAGAAVDRSIEDAATRADGEFWERYSACFFPTGSIPATPRHQLAGESIGLAEILDGHKYPSFEFEPPKDDIVLDWIPGRYLPDGASVWLPAQAVLMAHEESSPATPKFWDWSSTGLAAGSTLERAVQRGLLELVERSTFLYYWWRSEPGLQVSEEVWRGTVPAWIVEAVEACRPWRLCIAFLDSGFGVPVITAGFVHPGRIPAFLVGAAADFTLGEACRRAILEALQVFSSFFVYVDVDAPPEAPDAVRRFWDHALAYIHPDDAPKATWLFSGEGPPVVSGESTYQGLLVALRERGFRAAVAELTTRDARAAGYYVARVVVPGLQMIDPNHANRIISTKVVDCPINELNLDPHPFP